MCSDTDFSDILVRRKKGPLGGSILCTLARWLGARLPIGLLLPTKCSNRSSSVVRHTPPSPFDRTMREVLPHIVGSLTYISRHAHPQPGRAQPTDLAYFGSLELRTHVQVIPGNLTQLLDSAQLRMLSGESILFTSCLLSAVGHVFHYDLFVPRLHACRTTQSTCLPGI